MKMMNCMYKMEAMCMKMYDMKFLYCANDRFMARMRQIVVSV